MRGRSPSRRCGSRCSSTCGTDPFEEADVSGSMYYWKWRADRVFMLVAGRRARRPVYADHGWNSRHVRVRRAGVLQP